MKKILTVFCLFASLMPSLGHAKGLALWADANYIMHPAKGFYRFIVSEEEPLTEAQRKSLTWAVFKQNVNPVHYECPSPSFANNEAMSSAWCAHWNLIKGDVFTLNDPSVAATMFRGYKWQPTVLVADNEFVNTHNFPAYNRWMMGETVKSMPASFVTKMRQRYGSKVNASYEAASLRGTNGVLAVTDFGVNNGKALVVYTWLVNGKEVCTHEMRTTVEPGYENSVWSLDDEGVYGLPEVVTIARDKATGNIEFYVLRGGTESATLLHFCQNGNKLELVDRKSHYLWIDCKYTSLDALGNPALDPKDNYTTGLEFVSQGTPDDNGLVYRYANYDVSGWLSYGEVEGSLYIAWNTSEDNFVDPSPDEAWSDLRPDGATWERDYASEQVVAGLYDFGCDGVDEIVVCKRWFDEAHKKTGVGIAVVFPEHGNARFHFLSQGSCCVDGEAKVVIKDNMITIDRNNGIVDSWTWTKDGFVKK